MRMTHKNKKTNCPERLLSSSSRAFAGMIEFRISQSIEQKKLMPRIELGTFRLQVECSTAKLHQHSALEETIIILH